MGLFSFFRRGQTQLPPPAVSGMDGADIFYDVAMRRLDEQIERNEAFGDKATSAIAVGTTVLPISFGLLQIQGRQVPHEALPVLIAAVVSYGLLMVAAIAVLLPGRLDLRPLLGELDGHSKSEPDRLVKRWVARSCAESISLNDKKLKMKAHWLRAALVFLALETVFLSVSALVVIR